MLKKKANINFILSLVVVVPLVINIVFLLISGGDFGEFQADRTGFLIKYTIILSIYTALLFGFAFVAWMIFEGEGSRLRAYRVLMGIEYELQIILIGYISEFGLTSLGDILIVGALSIMVLYSAINTYTKRILD